MNSVIIVPFFRLKGPDFGINSEEIDEDEREIRVVLTAPHKGQFLSEPIFFEKFIFKIVFCQDFHPLLHIF